MRGIGRINVTQEPRAEPMHLDEAKAHLRMTTTDEDALVRTLISAARVRTEAILQRALVLQTVELAFDEFYDWFRLDRTPMMKFGSVQYRDFNGTLQTLGTTVYQVDSRSEPGRLALAYAQVWPQIRGGGDLNSVLITYQVGYLAPIDSVVNASDSINVKDNPFADTDKVYVSTSAGTLPAPLVVDTPYFVRDVSGDSFKLAATSGGAAINLTSDGTGQLYVSKRKFPDAIKQAMLLMIGHWNENREDSISGTIIQRVPFGAAALLAPFRLMAFS